MKIRSEKLVPETMADMVFPLAYSLENGLNFEPETYEGEEEFAYADTPFVAPGEMVRAYVAYLHSKPIEDRDEEREKMARVIPFMTVEHLEIMEKYVAGNITWPQYVKTVDAYFFNYRQHEYINFKLEFYPFVKDSIIKFDDPDNSTKELED